MKDLGNMNEEKLYDERVAQENIQLVKSIARDISTMSALIYEIKAGTPLGKTIIIAFHLFYKSSGKNICGISSPTLAKMAGVSQDELEDCLDYLQKQKIIVYKPSK